MTTPLEPINLDDPVAPLTFAQMYGAVLAAILTAAVILGSIGSVVNSIQEDNKLRQIGNRGSRPDVLASGFLRSRVPGELELTNHAH